MKIHEYQAAELFKEYGISSAEGRLADNPQTAQDIAQQFGSKVVVKAQVLVGGRGKAGGVALASSPEEAKVKAEKILALTIKNISVDKILIARAVQISKEYYVGMTIDRSVKKIVLMISAAGGMEIEELANKSPEQIFTMHINPSNGLDSTELEAFLLKIFEIPELAQEAKQTVTKIYKLFLDKDCSLVEINPYVLTDAGKLIAVDAKINFDDNAVFKHPEIEALRNKEEYSAEEIMAREANLSFVSLDGDIGCIVNGAGLAMATMDVIKLFGGQPANFLDVGGSSNPEKVINAFKIILSNKKVKAVLVNIFGGITRCDDIARGIIMAKQQLDIKIPLVIRLIGTNEKEGRDILKAAGIEAAENMVDAVKMVLGE